MSTNYALTYIGANLTINARPVTITADAKSKNFGDADPALTFQITSGSLITPDTFSGSLTRAAGNNVGTYAITQGTVALNTNYALTYIGANLTINARPVTVTANGGQTKVFGSANPPAYTYTITSGSLVTGDSFSGALTRASGEAVGSYAITQNTLALSSNYTLTYVGANFTITLASSTTTISCPVSVIYNGLPQTPCTAAVIRVGDVNTTATVVYGNNTNVGTATANATYAGDANHTGSTAVQVTFQIVTPPIFAANNVSGMEGDTGIRAFRFNISRTGNSSFNSTVCYNTIDGTATAAAPDNDYVPLVAGSANCVVFNPGDTARDVIVFINGDFVVEPNETFFLHLISATNGTASTTDGVGTILNDDLGGPPPPPGGNPEGDINRPALGTPGLGDGFVDVRDSAQFDRFADGRDCPQTTPNEFQRFDDNSLVTLGDGRITSADRTQLDRYIGGLDALRPAGGPTAPLTVTCTAPSKPETRPAPETKAVAEARIMRLVSATGNAGTDIIVFIESDAQGNEVGTQYSLNFNPRVMSLSSVSGTNPDVTIGAGAPAGTTLLVNAQHVSEGHIGIVENFNGAGTGAVTAGTKRIAAVTFHILPGAPSGASPVIFDDGVIAKVTSDPYGIGLGTTYDQNGIVSIMRPAAIGVTVSGRVLTPDGRSLRNATVTMVDLNGADRTMTTSAFGFYTFTEVATGGTYTIRVSSRLYRFAPRILQVTDSLTDVNFVGLE